MAIALHRAAVPAHELVYNQRELPRLRSNYGSHLSHTNVEWMKETPINTALEEMRRRFEDDGYVFVKNVIPRQDVLAVRQAYFEHLLPTGILKPGTSPRDGIFNPTADPVAHNGVGGSDLPEDIERVKKLTSAHTLPLYLAFLDHPKLRQFIRDFMSWEKDVLIRRTLLRHNVPNGYSTGIHYDRIFLRAGAAEFLTGWVPIGDCAAEGGGLMYLKNSSDLGRQMEADFTARAASLTEQERIDAFNVNMARDGTLSHDVAEMTKEMHEGKWGGGGKGGKWLVGNYEAGDVVFHDRT